MAYPLIWDEIFPGDTLYMECLTERGLHECKVLSRDIYGQLISVMVMEPTGKASCCYVISRGDPNFRFWNDVPTRKERDRTPWRALYE